MAEAADRPTKEESDSGTALSKLAGSIAAISVVLVEPADEHGVPRLEHDRRHDLDPLTCRVAAEFVGWGRALSGLGVTRRSDLTVKRASACLVAAYVAENIVSAVAKAMTRPTPALPVARAQGRLLRLLSRFPGNGGPKDAVPATGSRAVTDWSVLAARKVLPATR